MGPRTILIDGYNVIRRTPSLAAAERISLESGREALINQVVVRFRPTPHTVYVIFDGDGATQTVLPIARRTRGQIIFTRRGDSADAALQRIAAAECARGAEVEVVTDDMEVRSAIVRSGADATSVRDLQRHLSAPPKHLERLARHRQYFRKKWEAESEG